MADSACQGEASAAEPGWGDIRMAVLAHIERCAIAVARVVLYGGCDGPAVAELHAQNVLLQDLVGWLADLRDRDFSETAADLDRARAVAEALAAAGIPQPRPSHLHAVS